jgi:outer membrane protein insertion porin family
VERLSAALLAAALLLGAPAEGAAEGPLVVSGVVLKLPPGEDARLLEGLVAVRAGQPLSPRALRRTATLLYQLGRFSDVVIRASPSGEGQVVLVVECLPRRLVRSVRVVDRSALPVLPEEQLRRVAGLAAADEFWPGRLEDGLRRIRAALERRGYRRPVVAGKAAGETEVDVLLEVEAGTPTRVAALSLGGNLGAQAPALLAGLPLRPGGVLDLDELEAEVRQLRSRLRREGWLRARVLEPAVTIDGTSARVEIPVEEGPRIELRFVGNDSFGARELHAQLGLDPEQPVDEAAADGAASRLRGFYQERGWAAARVEAREVRSGDRAVVRFEIDEGRRYRVARVHFTGNQEREPAWLAARLREAFEAAVPAEGEAKSGDAERLAQASGSTALPAGHAWAEPGQAWHEPTFRQAVARVVDQCRAEGYLEAAHEGTRVVLDARAGTAEVEILLREGPRTFIESVAFEGNASLPLAQLLAATRIAPGQPLSYPAVEQSRAALVALYAERGWLYARIQDQEEFSSDRKAAGVRLLIEEGPQVRVASVAVIGNRRTREQVVRSTIDLKPGDVYAPVAAARSQTALLRLGVFRSAGLRLNDPEVPEPDKDLTVELSERPWLSVAPGFGFSIANGPRAFVEYSQPNLFGRALELAARAKVNLPLNILDQRPDLLDSAGRLKPVSDRLEGYANVGLHYPRLHFLPLPVAVHLDAIGERVHRKAYDMTRVSTVLGADLAMFSRLTFSLQGEMEVDDVRKSAAAETATLTRADVENLRFPQGITTLVSIRPTLSLDWRDNSVHPRSGWFASLTADYSHSLGYAAPDAPRNYLLFGAIPGSEVFTNMLKLQATGTWYVPVGRPLVLALSARGGRVLPLDGLSNTILPKRFYLGGASTMRGYAEDEMVPQDLRADYLKQVRDCNNSLSGAGCTNSALGVAAGHPPPSVGGQTFVLFKAEARIVVQGGFELGLFADVGNLWLEPKASGLGDLRLNVGAGLRFLTPIGPAVLDLGINTSPDRRLAERVYAPHFSIGFF